MTRSFAKLAQTCQAAAASATPGVAEIEAICLAYLRFAGEHSGSYRILFERSPANIAFPPHQYDEGVNAFALLVNAVRHAAACQSPTIRSR